VRDEPSLRRITLAPEAALMNATQGHILLVDDDLGITENLSHILEKAGFDIAVATDGEMAIEFVKIIRPDLVLLDIELPKLDGRLVLRRMRSGGDRTPVIIITGRFTGTADEVAELELGADDYIRKPFTSEVVSARIHAVLRRTRAGKPSLARSSSLKCRDLYLDRRVRRVYREKQILKLSHKEFALLECLMLHPDEVLSHNGMLDDLGWDDPILIYRYMATLRKALEDDPKSPTFIETVRTEGYRFIGPVEGEE